MNEHLAWFDKFRKTQDYELLKKKPIAYFSVEYALSDLLPTYAGGLGILAADYVRELADQKIPSVAVGLYYQSKYGVTDVPGKKQAPHFYEGQGLTPVVDKHGKTVIVKVPLVDHDVFVRAWVWHKGTVPVYLLDTSLDENDPNDRFIGYKLYDANKETRLKQEIILGIGGYRLLEALGIEPSIFHMNEGHSSLLNLEIIRHEMQKRHIGFREAMAFFRHHVVFTNHTLLAAGHEIYSNELFTYMLERYASELEVPVADIAAMGQIKDSTNFSLSLFALRLAGKINAVSKLHAQEAQKTWPDFEVEGVTNGIHLATWDKVEKSQISNLKSQKDTNVNFKQKHQENKRALIHLIKQETGNSWGENELLIGWARRMVPYKRPLALFGEIKRLKSLCQDREKPVRIVMAGVTHQSDDEGREMVRHLQEIMHKEFPNSAVYLPNYNVTLSKYLTSGCDVWLNTPVVGSEACGTSGMKAALNGVLACSTKDGWIAEVDVTTFGWELENDTVHESVLQVIEEKIIPAYYASDRHIWQQYMENGRELILKDFSTTRMLRDYFEKIYLPIIISSYEHYSV